MSMSLNALPILLALVLVLEYSSAETSAVSAVSAVTTTSPTSTVSTTSTTGKAASGRSATEEWKEWQECIKERQCDNVTCARCEPGNESCAWGCREECKCGCSGYESDVMDQALWWTCTIKRCTSKHDQCSLSCRGDGEERVECESKCELDMWKCKGECLQVTRAQAREAVAITAATSCRTVKETREEYYGRCDKKCEDSRELFWRECADKRLGLGADEREACVASRVDNCQCACAGYPSTTHYDGSLNSMACVGECLRIMGTCSRDSSSTEIERQHWCTAYRFKCQCACWAGAASGTDTAEFRTATEDRAQLELCSNARSCLSVTCGCLEGDNACESQCRDSCRCSCLAFPADDPGVQPAGGRLTVIQCRDKSDACVASCAGHPACIDWCFMEKETCNCKCAGRGSPPSPTKKKTKGDRTIVQHCNYIY